MNRNKGISGSTLKLIAIITMVIDHIGASPLAQILQQNGIDLQVSAAYQLENADTGLHSLIIIYTVCRMIGRISFPIFCFLLVEGYCHTHNVWQYAKRLFLFALISEIPFDLAFSGRLVNLYSQNVFFTLFLGLIAIAGMEQLKHSFFLACLPLAAAGVSAWYLRTDYEYFGVLLIVVFYLLQNRGWLRNSAAGILCLGEPASLLALIPIQCYNGRRGWNLKYIFYAFYPLHLLILWLLTLIYWNT